MTEPQPDETERLRELVRQIRDEITAGTTERPVDPILDLIDGSGLLDIGASRWHASEVEPIYRPSTSFKTWGQPVLVGYRTRAIGLCFHCGDETEARDDPYPDLCCMCQKAGRTSALGGRSP